MMMIKRFAYLLAFLAFTQTGNAQQPVLEDVIEKVNPSVVSIAVDMDDGEQALGAGMVISTDGYVVTNAHVTENARKIRLYTVEGHVYEAVLVGADLKTDIALLKAKENLNAKPLDFGDSDGIRVGNQVFAIGNPFGLGNSVSLGIISAKERDIEKGPYDSFLQTDASINRGNSGGPLFNMAGEVIGVNTAIFSTDGQDMGVGFATPSNAVKWVVGQLKEKGEVVRGWLGISVQKIRAKSAEKDSVLVVSAMAENSPAAKAGIKVGDVITALGEVPLNNPRIFSFEVAKLTPETEVPVVISRDGKPMDLLITVARMPSAEDAAQVENKLSEGEDKADEMKSLTELGIDKYRVRHAKMFPHLGIRAYYDENVRNFVVVEVEPRSDAALKGIKMGERIVSVNGNKIFGDEDMAVRVKEAMAAGQISLTLKDKNNTYDVVLKLDTEHD